MKLKDIEVGMTVVDKFDNEYIVENGWKAKENISWRNLILKGFLIWN